MVIITPGKIISLAFSIPAPNAIALGGVLTGNAIEVEHMRATVTTSGETWPSRETAIGMSRLAVAVLLMNIVIKAAKIPNIIRTISVPVGIIVTIAVERPLACNPTPSVKPPPSIYKMSQDRPRKSLVSKKCKPKHMIIGKRLTIPVGTEWYSVVSQPMQVTRKTIIII